MKMENAQHCGSEILKTFCHRRRVQNNLGIPALEEAYVPEARAGLAAKHTFSHN